MAEVPSGPNFWNKAITKKNFALKKLGTELEELKRAHEFLKLQLKTTLNGIADNRARNSQQELNCKLLAFEHWPLANCNYSFSPYNYLAHGNSYEVLPNILLGGNYEVDDLINHCDYTSEYLWLWLQLVRGSNMILSITNHLLNYTVSQGVIAFEELAVAVKKRIAQLAHPDVPGTIDHFETCRALSFAFAVVRVWSHRVTENYNFGHDYGFATRVKNHLRICCQVNLAVVALGEKNQAQALVHMALIGNLMIYLTNSDHVALEKDILNLFNLALGAICSSNFKLPTNFYTSVVDFLWDCIAIAAGISPHYNVGRARQLANYIELPLMHFLRMSFASCCFWLRVLLVLVKEQKIIDSTYPTPPLA